MTTCAQDNVLSCKLLVLPSRKLSVPVSRSVYLRAYAKLNLGLRVLYRRPDGFHEIRTVFQSISLSDRLAINFERSRRTAVTLRGAPDIPDNLAVRAAHACLGHLRIAARVEFHLTKRIPMGAGLGGGSSDAAAVLLALPVLAGGYIPFPRLLRIAAALGSDVPFFLHGGAALGLGKGDELYRLPDLRPRSGLVLAPGIHISTPEAYRALGPLLTDPEAKRQAFQISAVDPLARPLQNDFEAVVFPQHRRLSKLKRKLASLGAAPALMTGSGSAVFGLFDDRKVLSRAVQSLSGENVYRVTTLTGNAYRRRWLKQLHPHIEGVQWPPRSRYAQ